jgi:uncharacterized protein (TIGR03083 family)
VSPGTTGDERSPLGPQPDWSEESKRKDGQVVSDETDSARSEPVLGALLEEWAAIEDLLGGLDVTQWPTSTALPGWTVHDVVAHLIGTESRLAGDEEPAASIDVTTLGHVRNATGAANERWVRAFGPEPPEAMLLRFHDVTRRRAESLSAMGPEEFDAPTHTPVGMAPYRRFMEIRAFDCWLHEQDIRSAVRRPGHEDGRCAEVSVDEVVRALGFIVGKQASVPDGSAVTIELIGPIYRTVHVAVEGRAAVVTKLDRPATATLHLPSTLFVRLAGGRADALPGHDMIRIDGDLDLGRRIAQNLAFTI